MTSDLREFTMILKLVRTGESKYKFQKKRKKKKQRGGIGSELQRGRIPRRSEKDSYGSSRKVILGGGSQTVDRLTSKAVHRCTCGFRVD